MQLQFMLGKRNGEEQGTLVLRLFLLRGGGAHEEVGRKWKKWNEINVENVQMKIARYSYILSLEMVLSTFSTVFCSVFFSSLQL